ncbi:MAG: PEP-CTERM sorting domain-containing protein [Candidatus Competibacteraceae bacterium]
MNMQKLLVLGIAGLLTTTSASASLIGTNVTLNYHYGVTTTIDTLAVTAGVEVTCLGGGAGNANVCWAMTAPDRVDIDIGALSITWSYSGPGGHFTNIIPNGFDFENLDPGAPITSVALATDIPGLDLGRVTFSSSSIQVDGHNLPVPGPHRYFTLNISTATVPEPTSLALLGTGALLVLGYAQRHRNTLSRGGQVNDGQSAPA